MSDSLVEEQSCCDVCLEPIGEGNAPGRLSGCWPIDGIHQRYEVALCQACFLRVVAGLSRDRMLTGLFSEEPDDFRREDFGRFR